MAEFKVVQGRYIADLEKAINEVAEKYSNADVQQLVFDSVRGYTAIVKVSLQKHPCTYYNPDILLNIMREGDA